MITSEKDVFDSLKGLVPGGPTKENPAQTLFIVKCSLRLFELRVVVSDLIIKLDRSGQSVFPYSAQSG